MGTQVNNFKRYFGASAKGEIPFQPGFTIVGKVGGSKPQGQVSKAVAPSGGGIVSISPAIAAQEQATSLVGGATTVTKKRKYVTVTKKRKYVKRAGRKKTNKEKHRNKTKKTKTKSKKVSKSKSVKIHRKEAL